MVQQQHEDCWAEEQKQKEYRKRESVKVDMNFNSSVIGVVGVVGDSFVKPFTNPDAFNFPLNTVQRVAFITEDCVNIHSKDFQYICSYKKEFRLLVEFVVGYCSEQIDNLFDHAISNDFIVITRAIKKNT